MPARKPISPLEEYNCIDGTGGLMATRSRTRLANGVVSAGIVVFFIVHASLGSIIGLIPLHSGLAWAVWIGVACATIHVALCIATSIQQLTDTVRPPSINKKRHLVLKWATGVFLLVCAAVHVVVVRTAGADDMISSVTGVIVIVALAVALAAHICVGSKSLLKDLNVDRSFRPAVRGAACTFAALFVLAALVGFGLR